MTTPPDLNSLDADQLRQLAAQLLAESAESKKLIHNQQLLNDKLKHELAILKRHRFGKSSEGLNAHQASLLDELVQADIAAIEMELSRADTRAKLEKRQPKRAPLPAELPRQVIEHEPDSTQCTCGCQLQRIGEDISEKLDYTPGTFTVERHIRGKWACKHCERITQAPVPAQIIDKGIPTSGLLAHLLIAKFADHLPLYRQEKIFARAGLAISRSTLAEWVGRCGVALQPLVDALREELLQQPILHADETPVPMLAPGKKKTHRAYIWAYCSTSTAVVKSVVYDFAETRAGANARSFLDGWQGKLVCDDYSGYKAGFSSGITEIGCMAHARRKFYDLHVANKSQIAEYAMQQIQRLYEIEREAKELTAEARKQQRQQQSKPLLDNFHQWLLMQRQKVPNGSATAKAIDYSLKRWQALTRYCDDGAVPIDNNHVENQIRPWALGRSNWLFAGSLRGGQSAAAIMSLIQSAKLNGHDPYAYLKDVMQRLPTQRASAIGELLPHNWTPADKV
ncbi:IS66 family transposase [Microbulbifer sp. SH-1]|uniref:IS66 family transposase n=1 Tax=Microbulbifer sp. SH-1 TaxID=2681547 RepID=UPI00140C1960|nr:IS66 family transposase [Microbulbifer sp. SH-1]QIL91530.1 IS66 family transposase [Microbulbifer sp. SH-1]